MVHLVLAGAVEVPRPDETGLVLVAIDRKQRTDLSDAAARHVDFAPGPPKHRLISIAKQCRGIAKVAGAML